MEDELIKHIKDGLADHEFDYRPGAWENFKKSKKQHRTVMLWLRLAGVAAILIIAFLLFLMKQESPEFKKNDHQKLSITADNKTAPIKVQKDITPKELLYTPKNKQVQFIIDTPFRAGTLDHVNGIIVFHHDSTVKHLTDHEILIAKQETKSEPADMPAESEQHLTVQSEPFFSRDKWKLSLSMGQAKSYGQNNQLGLGAFVTYQISRKLALSSGFYFNQLGAKKDIDKRPMSNELGKYLVNVRSNLAGLEIPLELKYNITSSFYSKVGFSAYSITSQQQILLFNEEKTGVKNYVDADGTAYSETVSFTESRTIEVPKAKLNDNKLVGLYNISVGFEPRIFGKQKFAFEPFLKIPIDDFSKYRVNLSQVGLKINVNF